MSTLIAEKTEDLSYRNERFDNETVVLNKIKQKVALENSEPSSSWLAGVFLENLSHVSHVPIPHFSVNEEGNTVCVWDIPKATIFVVFNANGRMDLTRSSRTRNLVEEKSFGSLSRLMKKIDLYFKSDSI